jgi:serine/threonine protein kinase
VYLVKKKNNGKIYALKAIKKSLYTMKNQVMSSKSERDILAIVKSPFIVSMHYAFQSSKKFYFVMDFLNGGELFHHLKLFKRFSEDTARFYSAQIILALECLHQNSIIYRQNYNKET